MDKFSKKLLFSAIYHSPLNLIVGFPTISIIILQKPKKNAIIIRINLSSFTAIPENKAENCWYPIHVNYFTKENFPTILHQVPNYTRGISLFFIWQQLFFRIITVRASSTENTRVKFLYFFGKILNSKSEGIMNNDTETIELPWEKPSQDLSSDSTPLTQDELEELMHEIRF